MTQTRNREITKSLVGIEGIELTEEATCPRARSSCERYLHKLYDTPFIFFIFYCSPFSLFLCAACHLTLQRTCFSSGSPSKVSCQAPARSPTLILLVSSNEKKKEKLSHTHTTQNGAKKPLSLNSVFPLAFLKARRLFNDLTPLIFRCSQKLQSCFKRTPYALSRDINKNRGDAKY